MCDIDSLKSRIEDLRKQLDAEENTNTCLELQKKISIIRHKLQAHKDRECHHGVQMPEYSFPQTTPRY